jgi:hypothetical protein
MQQGAKAAACFPTPSLTEITMNQRLASILGFVGSVAAAALAAAVMSGNALAETPTAAQPAFVGSLTRADVRAELLRNRAQITSYGIEWSLQQREVLQPMGGLTRAQVRADYIDAREEVRAMNSEAGGSHRGAPGQPHRTTAVVAATAER